MSRNYSVTIDCTNTASSTLGSPVLLSTAAVQPGIYEINSGSAATPANNAGKFAVCRGTSLGALQGAVVFQALDPGAGTAVAAITTAGAGVNGATYANTIGILTWCQNQNTAYRWVASSPTRMLKLPSTAAAGATVLPLTVSTAWVHTISIDIEE